jgi:HK97 family phage major capsid protein
MKKETKMSSGAKAETAELMAAFEGFKQANEARLSEIEAKGAADPLTDERLQRIDRRLEALSLKMAAPERGGPVETAASERDVAWGRYLRMGDESGLTKLDVKALNTGTDSQGGYVAPPELDRLIEARLTAASPMRQIASVRQTSAGVFKKPVSLGAAAAWAGETEARPETAAPDLSLIEFPAGELYAMPAATQTLLTHGWPMRWRRRLRRRSLRRLSMGMVSASRRACWTMTSWMTACMLGARLALCRGTLRRWTRPIS